MKKEDNTEAAKAFRTTLMTDACKGAFRDIDIENESCEFDSSLIFSAKESRRSS